MDKMLLPFLEAHIGRYETTLRGYYEGQGGMPPYVKDVIIGAHWCKRESNAERYLFYFYSLFSRLSRTRRAVAGSYDALHCELVDHMRAIKSLNIFAEREEVHHDA